MLPDDTIKCLNLPCTKLSHGQMQLIVFEDREWLSFKGDAPILHTQTANGRLGVKVLVIGPMPKQQSYLTRSRRTI